MLRVDKDPSDLDGYPEEVTESEYIFRRLKEAGKAPTTALANLIDVLASKHLFSLAEIQKIADVEVYKDKEQVEFLND